MHRPTGRAAEILLVEDNPGDAELTRLALERARLNNNLAVVETGSMALDYLKRKGEFAQRRKPDLVLLDLNLPGIDGREVLARMKEDPDLKHIPVIVLTTSRDEGDVLMSYRLHANAYVTKPVKFKELIDVVSGIGEFWLEIVTLPSGEQEVASHG